MNSQRSDNPTAEPHSGSSLEQDGRWKLVLRVAASQEFSRSVRMRQLLLYVCEKAVTNCAQEMHEQQIGMRSLRVARATIRRKTISCGLKSGSCVVASTVILMAKAPRRRFASISPREATSPSLTPVRRAPGLVTPETTKFPDLRTVSLPPESERGFPGPRCRGC